MISKTRLKKYRNVSALLGFTLFMTFILYKDNKPIKKKDLIAVNGTLIKAPELTEQGGDMPYQFIKFYLKESTNKFVITGCSYDRSDKEAILKLRTGLKVTVFVRKNNFAKKKQKVYALINGGKYLLSLSEFNKCYVSEWKGLLIFNYVIVGILVVMFFNDIRIVFFSKKH